MKIILVCSSDYMAIPAALVLQNAGMLAGIVLPAKHEKRLLPSFLQSGFDSTIIHLVSKETLESELGSLIESNNVDSLFVITFPWLIPSSVLNKPKYGCINFHPGMLPKYKGADPIFWQLRNREEHGGFTVHRMTENIDSGPVILLQKMPIIPGETYGLHHNRLGTLASEVVLKVAELIQAPPAAETTGDEDPPLFFKLPNKKEITIDWEKQSAAEIEALVNAGNPKYNGAYTSIRHMELSILDVGFADISNAHAGTKPGTIVYSDALYGPIVACADGRHLRINTVCLPEGFLSGSKLFSLGFTVGEQFFNKNHSIS